MKTSIVPIGNSKGIRIPKVYLTELHIEKDVDIQLENQSLVIKAIKTTPRKGWGKKFAEMHKNGDDKLLISDNLDIDDMDFEWK